MEKLIIIANLGRVRPVKFKPAGDDPLDEAHLLEEPGSTVEMRPQSIHQAVTDSAGRFPQGGPADRLTGMSYGEEHHLEDELEKQALERVAGKIGEIVACAGYPVWRLVIPQEIMPSLLKALPPAAHKTLGGVMAGDLTKLPLPELEKRFLSESVS
jgi:hypothetical protein